MNSTDSKLIVKPEVGTTLTEAMREGALLALKEQKEVDLIFNEKVHPITLELAEAIFVETTANVLFELSILKQDVSRTVDALISRTDNIYEVFKSLRKTPVK